MVVEDEVDVVVPVVGVDEEVVEVLLDEVGDEHFLVDVVAVDLQEDEDHSDGEVAEVVSHRVVEDEVANRYNRNIISPQCMNSCREKELRSVVDQVKDCEGAYCNQTQK